MKSSGFMVVFSYVLFLSAHAREVIFISSHNNFVVSKQDVCMDQPGNIHITYDLSHHA